QVSAVDANGCLSGQASILVSVYPPITVIASPDAIICSGDNTTLYAVASGGNGGPYTYSWLGAGMGSNITVSPLDTMMYIVQAMDNCGSPTDMDTVMVFVMEAPVLIEMPGSQQGCAPLLAHFEANATLSSGTTTYLWNFGDVSSGANNSSDDPVTNHYYENAGTYDVMLTLTAEPAGCSTTYTWPGMIDVNEVPEAEFYMSPEISSIFYADIDFFDQSVPGDEIVTWIWDFGDSHTATVKNPDHTYSTTGTFPVQLIVATMAGCADTVIHYVEIKEEHTFYAPTAFSPNSGLQNNYFYPKGIGIDPDEYHLYIYDRWGEVIFETDVYPEGTDKKHEVEGGWNGRYKNTGDYVKLGTYTWYVTLRDVNGQQHEYVGAVTVIR
ncbi:MAG: PKD domain-containing protein, partial [Bacteroidota bacterium]